MAWTAEERSGPCEWSTALLLVRTIEVCSGRHSSTDHQLNVWEYTQLEELTSSICRKLAARVLAKVCIYCAYQEFLYMFIYPFVPTVHDFSINPRQ